MVKRGLKMRFWFRKHEMQIVWTFIFIASAWFMICLMAVIITVFNYISWNTG